MTTTTPTAGEHGGETLTKIDEVAAVAKMSPDEVRAASAIERGIAPIGVRVGGDVVYRRQQVEAWLSVDL